MYVCVYHERLYVCILTLSNKDVTSFSYTYTICIQNISIATRINKYTIPTQQYKLKSDDRMKAKHHGSKSIKFSFV